MQAIIREDHPSGEMCVEYFKVVDKMTFRFELLTRMIGKEDDITVVLDTNQKITKKTDAEIEDFLRSSQLEYTIKPIESNPVAFLGLLFTRKKKKVFKRLILLPMRGDQFTRELYRALLKDFDIGIGIGKQKPLEEITEFLRLDMDDVLFKRSYFRESVYDSILCTCLRSSFDIAADVEAVGM